MSANVNKNDSKNSDSNYELPSEYVSGEYIRQEMQNLTPRNSLPTSWQQKFAVIFLFIFGSSAIVLWVVQFNSGLQVTQPLAEVESINPNSASTDLNTQDSDKDGISDYNELNLYNTSPYLEDTDSDGINDKTEIDAGEDPNCPVGQNCFSTEIDNSTDISNTTDSQNTNQPAFNTEDFNNYIKQSQSTDSQTGIDTEAIQSVLGGEADVQVLRRLLLDSGMDSNTLDNFSDDQLLSVYKNTLQGNNN